MGVRPGNPAKRYAEEEFRRIPDAAMERVEGTVARLGELIHQVCPDLH